MQWIGLFALILQCHRSRSLDNTVEWWNLADMPSCLGGGDHRINIA